jgi:hypothetical protein
MILMFRKLAPGRLSRVIVALVPLNGHKPRAATLITIGTNHEDESHISNRNREDV